MPMMATINRGFGPFQICFLNQENLFFSNSPIMVPVFHLFNFKYFLYYPEFCSVRHLTASCISGADERVCLLIENIWDLLE